MIEFSAIEAWSGSRPLPRAVICWFWVSSLVSVTHPVGRPMSHSTNAAAGRGPSASFRSAGAGAVCPVTCSHRVMASA